MGGIGSGGHNRLTPEEHARRGTVPSYRRERDEAPSPVVSGPATAGERRRALRGLRGPARELVRRTLDTFGGWDPPALVLLRELGECAGRLAELAPGDDQARHREARLFAALRRALRLEGDF